MVESWDEAGTIGAESVGVECYHHSIVSDKHDVEPANNSVIPEGAHEELYSTTNTRVASREPCIAITSQQRYKPSQDKGYWGTATSKLKAKA